MKKIVFLTATAFLVASAGVASANHMDERDFTDLDASREYFVCHTDDHLNDRFVFNPRDRDFCNEELLGHVILLESPEAALHASASKIICYQRNRVCVAENTN
ncbi:MAG: hypothetical protein O7C63_10040 [Alphaproteobacteria bacterium]|nr:hypothetical protein [Alphaproteobacteria bacterium]